MRRRSDSLKANLCQAQQRDLKTMAPLLHRLIVLTNTIDYQTIGFSHYHPNPNFCISSTTLTAVRLFHLPALWSGTLSQIWSGTQRSVRTVSDVFSKHICLLDTSASTGNALRVLDDNVQYKFTYLLTYLPTSCTLWYSQTGSSYKWLFAYA